MSDLSLTNILREELFYFSPRDCRNGYLITVSSGAAWLRSKEKQLNKKINELHAASV
jgi:hypothetical protein